MLLRPQNLRYEGARAVRKATEWLLGAHKLQQLSEATDWAGAGSREQCARWRSPHL